MLEIFTPSAWKDIGVVTLIVLFGVLWVVAQVKGWIVMGREFAAIERENEQLAAANADLVVAHAKKDQTILELSEAARASTVAGEATLKALETAKELYGGAR